MGSPLKKNFFFLKIHIWTASQIGNAYPPTVQSYKRGQNARKTIKAKRGGEVWGGGLKLLCECQSVCCKHFREDLGENAEAKDMKSYEVSVAENMGLGRTKTMTNVKKKRAKEEEEEHGGLDSGVESWSSLPRLASLLEPNSGGAG